MKLHERARAADQHRGNADDAVMLQVDRLMQAGQAAADRDWCRQYCLPVSSRRSGRFVCASVGRYPEWPLNTEQGLTGSC
ncbi:hypothetical protein NDU88_001300 [Pleurodeles waltl]|uniref:Uncharacterized protein n=1 Tax=Pleurodeles waltl TaxID=8319 RepID=A0AAV7TI97_PLEWA|nr:hypothetical protein NDU88_001300 [Pleurodeles waltl]